MKGLRQLGAIPALGTIHIAAITQQAPVPCVLDLVSVSGCEQDLLEVFGQLHAPFPSAVTAPVNRFRGAFLIRQAVTHDSAFSPFVLVVDQTRVIGHYFWKIPIERSTG
jgi:hypothetical protein